MELQVADVIQWMEKSNDSIQANKDYLSSLDRAIGDGDHGINMARGFQEVVSKLTTSDYQTVSDVLKDVSMTLLSKVGGASGPLFGTAFLKMSTTVKGMEKVDANQLGEAFQEALNGIKLRGKANKGDKTLVDVWEPVVEFFKSSDSIDANALAEVAKQAMESTKELEARRGRAAYLKERSIGHLDPGSVSSYYIFTALSEVLQKGA
ncbi:dihydroxyacetone kinase subunit DhaL [Ornithinibacillus halotolerans]|uniref:phosphoenolpyruvate--glycerone phosphotransferase n=1 Tax=Ornithinibacillus halotolerans TaxID=1274357 RepID=A0A916SB90_9BACI|nr:dihydroxyacetone kinase subunit DhaL [Ornithinibacillus halotolerans]GGA91927.1 dihydroxyacetone kinase subunit L [Ornithinibacillus halotolerans]